MTTIEDFRQFPLIGIDPRGARHYLDPNDIRNALCGAAVGINETWHLSDTDRLSDDSKRWPGSPCGGCLVAWNAGVTP